jgi:hypothetical protein
MRSLKEILEGLLSGQEQTIEIGNNFQNRNDLIASWKNHYINFNVFVKEHFMKDAKSHKCKLGPQHDSHIENFDPNKKYFLIAKEKAGYKGDSRTLTKENPMLSGFSYAIYINDDKYMGQKMLSSGDSRTGVIVSDALYWKNGKYYPLYNDRYYERKTSVSNFMFDYGKNKVTVYEVPKKYEWLYNYIKEGKLI